MNSVELIHSPNCQCSIIVAEEGTTYTVTRCADCGAVSTMRNTLTPLHALEAK